MSLSALSDVIVYFSREKEEQQPETWYSTLNNENSRMLFLKESHREETQPSPHPEASLGCWKKPLRKGDPAHSKRNQSPQCLFFQLPLPSLGHPLSSLNY